MIDVVVQDISLQIPVDVMPQAHRPSCLRTSCSAPVTGDDHVPLVGEEVLAGGGPDGHDIPARFGAVQVNERSTIGDVVVRVECLPAGVLSVKRKRKKSD